MTEWKSQIGGGKYAIQFETDNYASYKAVEKACQKEMDKKNKAVMKKRKSQARALGHI